MSCPTYCLLKGGKRTLCIGLVSDDELIQNNHFGRGGQNRFRSTFKDDRKRKHEQKGYVEEAVLKSSATEMCIGRGRFVGGQVGCLNDIDHETFVGRSCPPGAARVCGVKDRTAAGRGAGSGMVT